MYILALDTATKIATAAVTCGDKVLADDFVDNQKTHSQNLMPLIKRVINASGLNLKEIDAIAVTRGPGSFTGIRIGMATAKTLAQVLGVPITGISTLEALACNFISGANLICPILDARKNEVYSALYLPGDKDLRIIIQPAALSIEELIKKIENLRELNESDIKITFLGDGVPVYKDYIKNNLEDRAVFAQGVLAGPRGSNVALLGYKKFREGFQEDYLHLLPDYLRKSEAEVKLESRYKPCECS